MKGEKGKERVTRRTGLTETREGVARKAKGERAMSKRGREQESLIYSIE